MKRRDFLKAPAAGLLLAPGFNVAQGSPRENEASGKPDVVRQDVQQRMHPDFITCLPGVEYFFFGNGDITGVVQHCPKDTSGTFLGLTFMNPGLFSRKWSTYLYHPERGFREHPSRRYHRRGQGGWDQRKRNVLRSKRIFGHA